MNSLLITGGLGHVGFYLVHFFKNNGFSVRIFDLPTRPADLPQDIEYFQGDVTDKNAWPRALQGIDYVVHLAAYSDYREDFSTYLSVNAVGTALLYETIAASGLAVKQIVVASSQSVYGEGKYYCKQHGIFYPASRSKKELEAGHWDIRCPHEQGVAGVLSSEESDMLLPVSPYGISKAAQDLLALTIGREYEIPSVALRFSIVHGAYREMKRLPPGALNFFVGEALEGAPIFIHEDGNQIRDFINIKDLGPAHLAVLGNPACYFQAFNVGSGVPRRIKDLAEQVIAAAGSSSKIVTRGEFRPFTPRHWVLSTKKLAALGWQAQYSFEDNIREYVKKYQEFHAA